MPDLENQKHENFCNLVAMGTPYATAYMESGFHPGSRANASNAACALMRRDDIKTRIAELKIDLAGAIEQRFGITREWLMLTLERNIRVAFGEEPHTVTLEPQLDDNGKEVLDEEGKKVLLPVGHFKYEPAVANKSLELMGKLIGEFRNNVELTGAGGGPIQTGLKVEFIGAVADAIVKAAPNA